MPNRVITRDADCRVTVVRFLYHRAEQTGVIGKFAVQARGAHVDVPQHPFARIVKCLEGGLREECIGDVGKVLHGRDRQGLFVLKVVEKRALADPRLSTQFVDRRRRIALHADHVKSRVEELCPGGRLRFDFLCAYQLVGII